MHFSGQYRNGRKDLLIFENTAEVVSTFAFSINTNNTSTGSTLNTQFALPLISTGTYAFTVDWGDGNTDDITTWNQAEVTHTYASAGAYNISITGTIKGWRFNNTGDRRKFLNVSEWGPLLITEDNAFYGCQLFTSTATDVFAFDITVTPSSIFSGRGLFRSCSAFTQDLSLLDVAGITTWTNGFLSASAFNGDVSTWDMSSAVSLQNLFSGCTIFNQNLSAWDVSNVTNFSGTFSSAKAFNNAGDSGISLWNTSAALDMSNMFNGANNFTQQIGTWDVSNVTNMISMMRGLGNTSIDISSWDISSVTNFVSFAFQTKFDTAIYDATLIAWDALSVQPSLNVDFGTSVYTIAVSGAARANLISSDMWTIIDGGGV